MILSCRHKRGSVLVAIACAATILAEGRVGFSQAPTSANPRDGRHIELGLVPLVGGDTDVGVGFGFLSTVASVAPQVKPYVWAVESAGFFSVKRSEGSFINPYQDYSIQLTAPQLMNGRLRLEIRPSYTKETTQKYYGLGNASIAPTDDVPERDFYGRTHPTLWVRGRYRIWDHFHLGLGTSYTENWLQIRPQSTLGQQMNGVGDAQDPAVQALLGHATRHGVLLLEGILLYDTRDSETVTDSGQMHMVRVRVSPRIAGDVMPYQYQQVNLSSRLFFAAIPERLVVALRAVADMQFDNPPFYELARYDDTFALGGQNGVRGVPGQRYYGKIKVFANFEVRSQLVRFKFWGKQLTLGAALFFDAGRAWAEWASHPDLDGTGWGLKYGTGGGLRLQQGKTFVVRADLAWSPDARPVGGYVGAGQTF